MHYAYAKKPGTLVAIDKSENKNRWINENGFDCMERSDCSGIRYGAAKVAPDMITEKSTCLAEQSAGQINNQHTRRCAMPRGDGTGPAGMGSMSGRGAGYCAGFGTPGFVNRGAGFGGGFGRGLGRGFGRGLGLGFGRATTPWFGLTGRSGGEAEQTLLKNRAEALKTQLDAVQQRLSELEKAD